jgi:hypothetical protein
MDESMMQLATDMLGLSYGLLEELLEGFNAPKTRQIQITTSHAIVRTFCVVNCYAYEVVYG